MRTPAAHGGSGSRSRHVSLIQNCIKSRSRQQGWIQGGGSDEGRGSSGGGGGGGGGRLLNLDCMKTTLFKGARKLR